MEVEASVTPSTASHGFIAPRLDWRTLIGAKPDTTPDILAALDSYFMPFAQPPGEKRDGTYRVADEHPCLRCGERLMGLTAMLMGGGFTWGLAHGEGYCVKCKWPARAHHFIKNTDGSDLLTVRNFILQYHPDFVEKRSDHP